MATSDYLVHPSSYRDPAGFVFQYQSKYYRQVNKSYSDNYDLLISSGLYKILTEKKSLIAHSEVNEHFPGSNLHYKTLLPQQVPFISYPYEWSFDMLKDAALLTLEINNIAIAHGMILKDATGFNIQFINGKPVFIDTLSFEKYDDSRPWIAYRQFCESFLFPLYLSHYCYSKAQKLLSIYPDGIPLLVTAKLLPYKSRFNLDVWMHVYLQKKAYTSSVQGDERKVVFSKHKMKLLLDSLMNSCKRLKSNEEGVWNNYYEERILSKEYLEQKEKIFNEFLYSLSFKTVIDLGSNEGHFSLIAAKKTAIVISTDSDAGAVNNLYKTIKQTGTSVLPLVVDICNPTPAVGFNNEERNSFVQRAKADLVLALALVHHLSISKNITFAMLAEFLQNMGHALIIEFVPKEDEKVKVLLKNKTDIFDWYTELNFEEQFARYFAIEQKQVIPGTARILYRMSRKS
ncbi:MAG: hypothetical protein ABI415_03855 [Flavitalea sp.]